MKMATRKSRIVAIEAFDPSSIKWEVWQIKFEAVLKIAEIDDDESKVAVLISNLSGSVLESLVNMCKPKMPTDFTVKELLSKLTENFEQVSFTVAERCKFFKMCQNNETLTEFALKLKQQADKCEFPNTFYEEALITAFVMNIDSTDIRTHLFQKTFKTFNECVECAKTLCCSGSGKQKEF
ncbi:hypothetical protein ILUMI_12226 [Ignelater luminosus]|uniref:Retrotransposon gag domain-containing protein n=1 Tax=Ignelater luminosus TaxID=2038154 RepID=A0A8K0G9R6_IGNLU|nr:hypothetical protein ILUMI_12226 [Ignelater luminosus]